MLTTRRRAFALILTAALLASLSVISAAAPAAAQLTCGGDS